MAFKDTIVEFIIKGRDLFSPAADKAAASAEHLEKSSKALNDELANIEGLQAQTKRYSELNASLGKTEQAYKDVSLSLNNQLQQQKQAKTDLKAAQTAYDNVKKSLSALEAEQKQSNSTSAQTKQAIAQKRDELNKLELEYKQAVTTNAQFNLQVKETRSEVNKLGTTFNKNKAELASLESSLKSAKVNLDDLGNESKKFEQKQNAAKVAITNVNNQLEKQARVLNASTKTTKEYSGSVKGVVKDLALLATAYVGLDQVGQAVKNIFTTGDKFEKLSIQMTALMGSIADGEKATAWIKGFTKNTPLQMSQVSEAFVKLKAFGLDPMDGTLQAVTDQALKLGGGFQEVEGISLALGQAWAKQKLQGEEILQLVERGIPVWDLLEKVTGKNTVELNKLSSAGKLGRDVIKALIDEMGKGAAGSAAANMALLSGQVSNAKDNFDQFYNLIAQSGAMDWLKGQLTGLNKQFADMAADGSLKKWAQSISDTIVSIGNGFKSTVTTLYEFRDEIATVAKVWLALKVGNFFSNIVSGSTAAILSLKQYVTSVVATDTATKSATLSATKWSAALRTIGKAGLYTWLIDELIKVGSLYKSLLKAEESVQQSQQKSAISAKLLADQLSQISKATGLNITSMAQFDKLVADGKLVWDEKINSYVTAVKAQADLTESNRLAAIEEEKRQAIIAKNIELYGAEIAAYMDVDAQLKQLNITQSQSSQVRTLTVTESLKLIETLENQAQSLDSVRGGVDGFILSIDSAKAAMMNAGEQYSQQIVILDELRAKFISHNESLERQAFLTGDVSKAYAELGLTAGKALDDTATKMQGAFELIKQSNEPIALQQQAFLKWADAAIKAADATDGTVPATLRASAATLGLTQELDKLIAKANELKPVTDTNSEAVSRFKSELEKTSEAIAINQQVIKSSTATSDEKAQAQKALTIQQERLTAQTYALNKVQQLEASSLAQLQSEKRQIVRQMDILNQQYEKGQLTASEYNDKHADMAAILDVVNNLLGDFKSAQDDATNATRQGTQATREQVKANQDSVRSLRDNKRELDNVSRAYSNAAINASRYSASQGASVDKVVDYQEKNQSAYQVDSKEIQAEKERREHEAMQNRTFEKFVNAIKNASTINEINALFNKINKQLIYVSSEQKKQLNDALNAQKSVIAGQSNRSSNSSGSNSNGASSRSGSNRTNTPSTRSPAGGGGGGGDGGQNYNSAALMGAINQLTTAVSALNAQQKTTPTKASKVVRLELAVPGGEVMSAELLGEFQEQFMQKLEQLSQTQ